MQPTEQQVQRSLEALRRGEPKVVGRTTAGAPATLHVVPGEVYRRVWSAPAIRPEQLDRVRRRLAAGDTPSAEDIAGRMIGRLVCDRLR